MKVLDFTPARLDIRTVLGDAWSGSLTLRQGGAPLDLTGYTIVATVRGSDGSDVPITVDTTPEDLLIGKFSLSQLAASVSGSWDLDLTSPGGQTRTYIRGFLILAPA